MREQARVELRSMFDALATRFSDMAAEEIARAIRSEAKVLTPLERERQKRDQQSARRWRRFSPSPAEREAQRELGQRLVDIGFKTLAREYHPDKGGSNEAMARLNRARDHLKRMN
jgi:hypothetical protein